MQYNYHLKRLVLSYACIVCAHYLIVFLLLLFIYHKILSHIKTLKSGHSAINLLLLLLYISTINPTNPYVCADKNRLSGYYGATDMVIVRGHSEAKQRVLLYLFVFIVSGFCSESHTL